MYISCPPTRVLTIALVFPMKKQMLCLPRPAIWAKYRSQGVCKANKTHSSLLAEKSPSSEQMDLLRRRASARNVSSRISLRWPIHIINPVDKTKLSCNTPTDAAPLFLWKLTPFIRIIVYLDYFLILGSSTKEPKANTQPCKSMLVPLSH